MKVVIVLRDGSQASADDFWAYCDEHMPRFWIPRYIQFTHAMPKTPSQKIQKYVLRTGAVPGEVFDREQSDRDPKS